MEEEKNINFSHAKSICDAINFMKNKKKKRFKIVNAAERDYKYSDRAVSRIQLKGSENLLIHSRARDITSMLWNGIKI